MGFEVHKKWYFWIILIFLSFIIFTGQVLDDPYFLVGQLIGIIALTYISANIFQWIGSKFKKKTN